MLVSVLSVSVLSVLLLAERAGGTTTISNVIPRVDEETGGILDAHDSKVIVLADPKTGDQTFYWFAASYGGCQEPATQSGCDPAPQPGSSCGFRSDHNVTLFVSNDLSRWETRGVVFETATAGLPAGSVVFAPKTVYNSRTGEWVLWVNYIVGSFDQSFYAVASSRNPEGPFLLKNPRVTTMRYGGKSNGDMNLFVDTKPNMKGDELHHPKAYVIYTSISDGHRISIEELTDDFYATKPEANSGFFGAAGEAPVMWRNGGAYFVAFGSTCCYCAWGSVAAVYRSETSPLGPWRDTGSSLGDLKSQATDVFAYRDGQSGAERFLYIGDRWQSAADGEKGHDFTVFAPLVETSDKSSFTTAGFQDEFSIDLVVEDDVKVDHQGAEVEHAIFV
jgi:hypothetical protein